MTEATSLRPFLDDLFITDELDRRTPRPAGHLAEKRALQDLVVRMADAPEEVLPRFVALAMELTGGVAAGLSLYEREPTPGVFRWRHLHGSLSPFEGATTPREFSPCGVTLDRNAPVLSHHPERYYDWISDAGIVVPEVLLVPLYIGSKAPLGTLWIVSEGEGHFDRDHARAMTELAWFVGIALKMIETERALKAALDEQQTLTQEMSHRVKNLFAVADGMIRMGARTAATPQEMAEGLSGRLHALASAHALVSRNLREVGRPSRASDLAAVIAAVLEPHAATARGGPPRFTISGPSVPCGDRAINGVALIFHELATNAAKYGALSVNGGAVEVSWGLDGDAWRLAWTERGGPTVADAPVDEGFGSSLVNRTIASQFAGRVDYQWAPEGLRATMWLDAARLAI